MPGQTPSWNDNCNDLWRKIAGNLYDYALDEGATGINAPNWNDKVTDLERKAAYASAKTVDVQL